MKNKTIWSVVLALTLLLTGYAALGQYDSITLLSDGTNWIQVSKADN